MSGIFAMQLGEDYAIDFHIRGEGLFAFKTEKIPFTCESMAAGRVFLEEFQEIEINTEIPVALMVYNSDTSIRTYSLQDYYTRQNLKEQI